MGVPKFFRWLSERYPLVNQKVMEKNEFDCFYLDMNGIIHTCSQELNQQLGFSEDELFDQIFSYTNRLFRIVRPKKLIYLAIDGVAPRAKMNQQRSRRFRTAKERDLKIKSNESMNKKESMITNFDSNSITPGTDFMYRLSISFKQWLKLKVLNDPEWQLGCDIIFSGSEVPGEGEHKIMSFIRKMKNEPNYKDSRLRHCLYGLDADLIMLGLVSHEKNFTLLREKLLTRNSRKSPDKLNSFSYLNRPSSDDFHLLEISLLREMLFLEFKPRGNLSYEYKIDRVIDDFIFMCMLIGNDFLPGIPHLDISNGGLNLLVRSYKEIQRSINGYLTNKNLMHSGRVEFYLEKLSSEAEPLALSKNYDSGKNQNKTYKEYYYLEKFTINNDSKNWPIFIKKITSEYMTGLHWCLYYYHLGCPSWGWYYPQYYAPLGSDLNNLSSIKILFSKGRPFEPLIQLLAVLPQNSSSLLPESISELMQKPDSPVFNYYPTEFKIDMNGKRNAWEGVILLPFIDEVLLTDTILRYNCRSYFSDQEKKRNCFGNDLVILSIKKKKDIKKKDQIY